MPADDLMQPHQLRQRVHRGHQPFVELRQRHRLHLVVRLDLLVGEVNLALDIELVGQIQALLLLDTEAEAIKLFFELVELSIADDLLEAVCRDAALEGYGIARLKRVVGR